MENNFECESIVSLLGRKKFEGKWYDYKTSTQNYNKAYSITQKIKDAGNRTRIDTVKIKGKRTYNIFTRKGTRDEKPENPSWKEEWTKKGEQFEKMRLKRLLKEKPVIVDDYDYKRKGKEIHVDSFRRKLPVKKKFKKLP